MKRALVAAAAVVLSPLSVVLVSPPAPAAPAPPGGDATIVVKDQTLGGTGTIVVMCPTGQRALSGGAAPVNPTPGTSSAHFNTSAPVDAMGGLPTTGIAPAGWSVTVTAESGTLGAWRGFVSCSPSTDATMVTVDLIAAITSANVPCEPGRRAVGGGLAATSGGMPIIATSGPDDGAPFGQSADGSVPVSWETDLNATTADMRAVAVCVSGSDATLRGSGFGVPGGVQTAGTGTATCPAGQRAVSGGLAPAPADNNMRLGFVAPAATAGAIAALATGAAPGAWTVQGNGYALAVNYRAYVVCITAPPDTTPPDTAITKGPKKKTHSKKAKVVFSSEPGATFTCKLDKKSAKPCTSPFKAKRLKPGKHKLTVTAVDAAGNADPSPATYRWKVLKKPHRAR
jgi:hypothetical protein